MIPPHNAAAEADLIGAALDWVDARAEILKVRTGDFYVSACADTHRAIQSLSIKGSPVNLTTVATELVAQGSTVNREQLIAWSVNRPMSWSAQLRDVKECASRRRLLAESETLRARALDRGKPMDETVKVLESLADRVEIPGVEPEPSPEITSLKDGAPRDPIFPGTLYRRDRVSVVARGGVGKSHLGFTAAIFCAAGVHLFTHERCPRLSSLVVDLENEPGDIGETATKIAASVGERYTGLCHAESRSQGMNLLNPRDVRWLESKIAYHEPALLVLGPLYKLFRGADGKGKHSEEAAEEVAELLDDLRVRYDCALWIENHPPHGEDRTRGSALWDGWFPLSFFMKRVDIKTVELIRTRGLRWRGRKWPWGLREGGDDDLPWLPVWDKNERLKGVA